MLFCLIFVILFLILQNVKSSFQTTFEIKKFNIIFKIIYVFLLQYIQKYFYVKSKTIFDKIQQLRIRAKKNDNQVLCAFKCYLIFWTKKLVVLWNDYRFSIFNFDYQKSIKIKSNNDKKRINFSKFQSQSVQFKIDFDW